MPRFPPVTNATLPRIENLSRIDIGGLTSSGGRRASCAFAKGGCPLSLRRRVVPRQPTSDQPENRSPVLEVGPPPHDPHGNGPSAPCRCKVDISEFILEQGRPFQGQGQGLPSSSRDKRRFQASSHLFRADMCVWRRARISPRHGFRLDIQNLTNPIYQLGENARRNG
jgi:hypothetical protein